MNDLISLIEDFDRIFDYGYDDRRIRQIPSNKYCVPSFPPVKITQNKESGSICFKFFLAGYSKENLNISFDGDFLSLKGEGIKEEEDKDEKIIANNTKVSNFSYRYLVPEKVFDKETTKAKFEDGILTVSIEAKKEEKKTPTKILIN